MKRWIAGGAALPFIGLLGLVLWIDGYAQGALGQEEPAPEQKRTESEQDESTAAAEVVCMTDDLEFVPRRVAVKAGETVEWKNASNLIHTVTCEPYRALLPASVHLPEGAEPFHSGVIDPAGRYRHTFRTPGRYRYFCVPHELNGMIGEVIVEPADAP